MYRKLATSSDPNVARALAEARREVEHARGQRAARSRDQGVAVEPPEFDTSVLYGRADALEPALYDTRADFERLESAPALVSVPGLTARPLGYIVGRRELRRKLRKEVVTPGKKGAVLTGAGGVGKSVLAASLLARLVRRGWGVVVVVGELSTRSLAEAVAGQLAGASEGTAQLLSKATRESVRNLAAEHVDDRPRVQRLCELLAKEPVAIVFDNFEDNANCMTRLGGTRDAGYTIYTPVDSTLQLGSRATSSPRWTARRAIWSVSRAVP